MQRKLGTVGYRIGLTVAVVAIVGLTAICWWVTPMLLDAPAGVGIASFALIAVMFALAILLIWMLLHENHGGE